VLGSVGVSEIYSFHGCNKKATCESYWENNSRSWSMDTPIFSLVISVDIAISALQQQRVSVLCDQPGYDPLHKITLVLDVINQMFYFNISCK
jgi:hypothetical protein